MKRISVFLLVIMMTFGLSACGTDNKPSNHAGDSGNVVSTQESKADNTMSSVDRETTVAVDSFSPNAWGYIICMAT